MELCAPTYIWFLGSLCGIHPKGNTSGEPPFPSIRAVETAATPSPFCHLVCAVADQCSAVERFVFVAAKKWPRGAKDGGGDRKGRGFGLKSFFVFIFMGGRCPVCISYTFPMGRNPQMHRYTLKIGHPKGKLVFQPSIFRCYPADFGDHFKKRGSKPSSPIIFQGTLVSFRGSMILDHWLYLGFTTPGPRMQSLVTNESRPGLGGLIQGMGPFTPLIIDMEPKNH